MWWACNTHSAKQELRFDWNISWEKEHLGDEGVCGRISLILKRMVRK